MTHSTPLGSAFSRRGFLAAAGAVGVAAALAACSTGPGTSAGSGGTLKFWDMPWGAANYNTVGKTLVAGYKPAKGLPTAGYQVIQWNNFNQTFASAIASKTNPAVSTGGGFQAFQFAKQGAIAYADDVISGFDKNGLKDDFLPNVLDTMKTSDGYVAVPWALDMRIWWYRKSILDEVGVDVPTTWDEYLAAGKKLAAKGYYAFGIGAGAGNNIGAHAMVTMMINNGGGLFNADGDLDVVTDTNVQAIDFLQELAREKIIDPAAVSYTTDNLTTQWTNKKIAMGINTPGLDATIGAVGDVLVMEPMSGATGKKGTLQFVNNIMMYKNNPSQEGTEAFLTWYVQNMKTYWTKNVQPALPVLQSIADTAEFKANTQKAKILAEWQPVAQTYAAQSSTLSATLATIDGGVALTNFAQTVLQGKTNSRAALTKLQADITSALKA